MEIIETVVWLKPADEGGIVFRFGVGLLPHLGATTGHNDRQGRPIYLGVRVSHVNASETESLQFGESGEVIFQLIYFDAASEDYVEIYRPLQMGREFEIRQGPQVIGYGCVQSRVDISGE